MRVKASSKQEPGFRENLGSNLEIEPSCERCGGDGVDPDQNPTPPLQQILNNDPDPCQKCQGTGSANFNTTFLD